jgi:hypothetical protein
MTRRHTIRPQLDGLEGRLAMAGNVQASFGEVLSLRGDAAANSVRITQNSLGTVVIQGLDGTTINGRASVSFNGSRLEKTDLRLFGGADRLEINNLRVSVDHNIEMGQGNDTVILNRTVSGVNTSVKTDDGTDRVTATGVRTGSDFSIETGQGSSNVSVSSSTVGKTLTIIGGDSADTVAVSGTTTRGDLNVEAKKGDDRITLTTVRSYKNIKVITDVGNDRVATTDVQASYDAVFDGGDGFDTFVRRGFLRGGQKLEIKGFERFA